MKKLLALALVVFGLAACQTEPQFDVQMGGEQEVMLTVSLPEATRASSASDALTNGVLSTHDLRYIIEVYRVNDDAVLYDTCQRFVETSDATSMVFPVRLAPGYDYRIVAWTDIVEKGSKADRCYKTTDGLDAVEIIESMWKPMDETRDAYTAVKVVDNFSSASNLDMILTRPFAKLRVVATDITDITEVGLVPTTATVEYGQDMYFKYNAVADIENEGAANDARAKSHTITYDATTPVYSDATGEYTLFTDYIFVPESGTAKFTLTVNAAAGVIKENNFNTEIFVERNKLTTIKGDVLTIGGNINVTVDEEFGGAHVKVEEAAYAQSELDNAIANTTIYLKPDVNYGTLLIRPVAGAANTTTDCDYLNYRNEMLRKVENLTIVGAPGAKVDGIKVISGYAGEGSNGYIVDIKNLVIDSVEFSDKYVMSPNHSYSAPIFIDLSYINVDGLTVKNCKLVGDNAKMNLVYLYGSGKASNSTFETAAKNIVIDNNTVDGIARLCELRQAENVTITNNTIKNTYLHGMLLATDKGKYSGNVTITNNTAEHINERFVRMSGAGDAVVVIKDNIINYYQGADDDFIKVTDGNNNNANVTIENNYVGPIANYDAFLKQISDDTWYDATKTELAIEDVADFAAFIETANSIDDFEGKTLKLTGDIDLYFKDVTAMADSDPTTFRPIGDAQYNGNKPFKGTFDGQGHTIKNLYQNGWDLGYHWDNYGSYGLFGTLENATVKNVVIESSESYIEGGNVAFIAGCAKGNCVFENIEIKSGVAATYNNRCGSIVGWSGDDGTYTFKNIVIGKDVVLAGLWGSFDSSIGGIIGQAKPSPSATYNFENITINCRIDAYNDCTASGDHYNYRMCGMIIGRCAETTTIDGKNYPDLSKYNLTFNNVVVNYGQWMNYHYCEPTPGHNGGRGMRIEPGYSYGGLPEDFDHTKCVDNHYNCIPFDQLIGGDQYGVKGLREVTGVTVNYPDEYTCPLCGQQHNVE